MVRGLRKANGEAENDGADVILFLMRIVPSSAHRGEVLRALRSLAGVTGSRRGCSRVRLLRDVENPNEITWIEEWDSDADLAHHVASDDYRKLLMVMDLSMSRPEVRFHTVSHTAGMERIAANRTGAA